MFKKKLINNLYNIIAQNYFFFCKDSTITSRGDAKNIDEYVPKNIPTMSISEGYFIVVGPKKNKENKAKMTVSEVAKEREKD